MSEVLPVVPDAHGHRSAAASGTMRIIVAIQWWHVVLVFFVLTIYWLTGLGFSARNIDNLRKVDHPVSGKPALLPIPAGGLAVNVNPLVRGTIYPADGTEPEGTPRGQPEIRVEIREDNVILMWGLCLGAILALAALKPGRGAGVADRFNLDTLKPLRSDQPVTAEQTLADDVAVIANRAADMYRRSTFLLAGGILMAFVGVTVFSLTAPTDVNDEFSYALQDAEARILALVDQKMPAPEVIQAIDSLKNTVETQQQKRESQTTYPILLARAIRPFGMLVFVEGIAWFLLRQYRSLIEDYKSFVRVQLKRSSYLIALRAALALPHGGLHSEVIRSLISEDLTGRIPRDQTTEAIEAMKVRDEGSVLESIKGLSELVRSKAAGA